jgi:hypothetical protein
MTTWYVQKGAGGGSGTLADPWQTFANVVWGAGGVVAGDTVTILGTYTSTGAADYMTIGASGLEGLPITITGGTIDCSDTGNYGVLGSGKSYITISGLTVLDALQNGVHFDTSGSNFTLSSLAISGCAERGINFEDCSEITITDTNSSNNTKYGIFVDVSAGICSGLTITGGTYANNLFYNLRVRGFEAATKAFSNVTVTGGTYSGSTNITDDGAGIFLQIIENATITGATISGNDFGIWTPGEPLAADGNFDNRNIIVRNCVFTGNKIRAVYLAGQGHRVENCTITSAGTGDKTLVYSTGSDEDCYIINNTFNGAGASESNITLNNGTHADAARTVYCYGNRITGGEFGFFLGNANSKTETYEIYNNIIDTMSENAISIRNGDNTQTTHIYNNTIIDCNTGLTISDGVSCNQITFKNNIITGSAARTYFLADMSDGMDVTSDYNCFLGDNAAAEFQRDPTLGDTTNLSFAQWQALGYDANSLRADPLYVDEAANDFHLSYNSPAANIGTDLNIATDFDGRDTRTPPDAGAYALYWLNNEKYGTTGYNDQYGTDHIGRDNNPKYEDDQNLVYSRLNNSAYED